MADTDKDMVLRMIFDEIRQLEDQLGMMINEVRDEEGKVFTHTAEHQLKAAQQKVKDIQHRFMEIDILTDPATPVIPGGRRRKTKRRRNKKKRKTKKRRRRKKRN